VVLLVFWATDCAVCRDKLPELRSTRAGWRQQPFEIVLVSTDRQLSDLKTYQGIAERLLLPEQRITTLWRGDLGFSSNLPVPTRLPAAWLVDKQGRLVEAWEGRIPAEAWDRIAELL
jgi:peroxiredoxin